MEPKPDGTLPHCRFPGSERAKERKISGPVEVVAIPKFGFALGIERQIGSVGQCGAPRDLAELPQLLRGEFALDRPSAPDDVNLPHPASRQGIEGVLGNVRAAQLVRWLRQDTAYVRSHVALSLDRHCFLAEVERPVAIFRVSVEAAAYL